MYFHIFFNLVVYLPENKKHTTGRRNVICFHGKKPKQHSQKLRVKTVPRPSGQQDSE